MQLSFLEDSLQRDSTFSNSCARFSFYFEVYTFYQIPHVIFQTKIQFFFKVWLTLQHHERSFFCTFLANTLCDIDKISTSECKFSDLPLFTLIFTKFLMSILELRTSFSSNFASLFSVMRHNSSVLFHLKLYMLWTKGARQSANFQDIWLCAWKLTKFLMSFFKPRVNFPLNLSSHIWVMIQFLWNFLVETLYALDTHQSKFFQTLQRSFEFTSCHFWNRKVMVYSNFVSLFSVMKDNSSVFL